MARLLIAAPFAAIAVAALFWVMREFVPAGRARVDYTVTILAHSRWEACQFCDPPPPLRFRWEVERPDENSPGTSSLPPPPHPRPQMEEPPAMPRERLAAPERTPPEGSLFLGSPVGGLEYPCAPGDSDPIVRIAPTLPDGTRDGDFVVLEFTITADGCTADIRVVESSNPQINDDVVKMVKRWRYRPNGEERRKIRTRIEFKLDETEERSRR
jgi:TonB family protein